MVIAIASFSGLPRLQFLIALQYAKTVLHNPNHQELETGKARESRLQSREFKVRRELLRHTGYVINKLYAITVINQWCGCCYTLSTK